MIAVGIPLPLKATDTYELKRDSSTTSLGSKQLMRKRNMYAFDAVDDSSRRHRERLLAVPSGLTEQHDGVGVLREADGEAIEEYVHGVGIDLGGGRARRHRRWSAARRHIGPPAVAIAPLLANPRLVHEPDLDIL